jgi:hypothetical protein
MTHDRSDDVVPSWSRDGHWIYFTSNRSGNRQVWKMPSDGGKAVQITKGGGHDAVESFDGRSVYYPQPGQTLITGPIWKVPCGGGDETLILNRAVLWTDWALRPEGICFSTQIGKKHTIEFLSFQTGKTTSFFQEDTPDLRRRLAISPGAAQRRDPSAPPSRVNTAWINNDSGSPLCRQWLSVAGTLIPSDLTETRFCEPLYFEPRRG